MPKDDSHTDLCRRLSSDYYEQNGTCIEILERPPSALEFARLVHVSRPVVIKELDVVTDKLWTNEYLIKKMGQRKISVAVTPDGRADAIVDGPDGLCYFTEPYTEEMTMAELLNKLDLDLDANCLSRGEIYYLQTQNGNLFSAADFESGNKTPSEFEPLRSDVMKEISWCSDAVGHRPDAVNIWIGNEKSTTSFHSDPYENIYTVVRGEKHFILLPPTDSWSLKERCYPHACYKRGATGELVIIPSGGTVPNVRWSSITDPDSPDTFPKVIRPIRITLHAGETLYLPIGWWHHVRQSGLTIALNWWYDAELQGMSWVVLNMLRNLQVPETANTVVGN